VERLQTQSPLFMAAYDRQQRAATF